MFSTITQLGKNFADEINRINDEVNNSSSGQQAQLTDPTVAKKIIDTETPEVTDIEKPEDLQEGTDSASDTSKVRETTPTPSSETEKKAQVSPGRSNDERNSRSDQYDISDLLPGTKIRLSELAPEVRSRLIKYVKYEKKYPSLYNAYKIEKKKSALIKAFETMLKENTPCASIGELNAVRDYLNSLNSKSELLNAELSKLTKEKSMSDEEIKTLKQKIKALQKAATSRSAEDQSEIRKLEDELKKLSDVSTQNTELHAQLETLRVKNVSLNEEIASLKESSQQNEKTMEVNDENDKLKAQLASLAADKEQLSKKCEQMELESSNNKQCMQEKLAEKDIHLLKLEKSVESSEKLNTAFKEKLEKLTEELKEVKATHIREFASSQSNSSSKPSSKSAKKKRNKSKGGQLPMDEAPENSKSTEILPTEESSTETTLSGNSSNPNAEIQLIELNHRFSELEDRLEEKTSMASNLERVVSEKTNEIEELKDMLRDVGDSLVESQKENKNTTDLAKELKTTKEQLEFKLAELEMLRLQNSKAIADYEKTKLSLSKKADDQSRNFQEAKLKCDRFELELKTLTEKIEDIQKKNIDLENLLSKYKKAEQKYQDQIKSLSEEKNKVAVEISSLKRDMSSNSLATAELEKLKVEISRKERFLSEAENRVKFLQEEKGKLNDSLIELKVQTKEYQSKNTADEEVKAKLTRFNESLKAEVSESSLRLNKLSLENTRLNKELEELRDQYNEVKHIKLSSSDQVEILKKRIEELLMRNKEYESKNHIIQEELSQSRNMLQERVYEMTTMRKLLNENEESQKQDRKEFKSKLDHLMEEKERSDKEYMLAIKTKQRDIDELKRKCNDLDVINEQLENANNAMKQQISELTTKVDEAAKISRSSSISGMAKRKSSLFDDESSTDMNEYSTKIIESLRDSLNKNESRLREYEEINTKLRAANQDTSEKMIRLNKKYKLLSQQYKKRFSQSSAPPSRNGSFVLSSSRHNSVSSPNENIEQMLQPEINGDFTSMEVPDKTMSATEEDIKEKSIYIRNVLLGFLEHKEQRQMLLPVIKMLLYMTDDDAKKMSELLTNK